MNRTTSNDGTTIAFDKFGEGPVVILFGGAFSSRGFGPVPKLAGQKVRHILSVR